MNGLSQQQMLEIWELGLGQHALDRALTMLAVADGGRPWAELAALSIGERDARLLALRAHTFGPLATGRADCPACREQLEFPLDLGAMLAAAPEAGEPPWTVSAAGMELEVRPPTSHDLAALLGCDDVASARQVLAQRCVLQARQGEVALEAQPLPEPVLAALAAHLALRDPQAVIELDLSCGACGCRWELLFDIGAFFWEEICVHARRLLLDVHTLARCYGWSEAAILALSDARRQLYLELAHG